MNAETPRRKRKEKQNCLCLSLSVLGVSAFKFVFADYTCNTPVRIMYANLAR
jgi:hypothetical protein